MDYMRLCFGVAVDKSILPYAEILPNVHRWWHAMCGCGDKEIPGELMKCMSNADKVAPVDLWEVSGEKDLWIVSPARMSLRSSNNFKEINLARMVRLPQYSRMLSYYEFLESIEFDFLEVLPSWFLARTKN